MRFNCFFYLVFTVFISCNSNRIIDKKWELAKLTDIKETVVDSFSIKPVNYLPYDIVRKDSFLIIRNLKSDTIFRVFSLPDFEYVGWFGKIGKGPSEFLLAPLIREHNGLIQLSEVRKIMLIDLPQKNIKNKFSVIKEFLIPGKLNPLNETFTLNDDRYYGITFTGKKSDLEERKELVYFDTKTNNIGSLIDFPGSLFGGLPKYSFLYPKSITVSPENDKFAFCYMLYPLIRIFNKRSEIIKEIWIEDLPK
ncbi:MAG: BF3164 family lipoprotein [Mangrovibacterium sp.]